MSTIYLLSPLLSRLDLNALLSRSFRAWRFCFRGGFPTWTRILNPFMEVFGAAHFSSVPCSPSTHSSESFWHFLIPRAFSIWTQIEDGIWDPGSYPLARALPRTERSIHPMHQVARFISSAQRTREAWPKCKASNFPRHVAQLRGKTWKAPRDAVCPAMPSYAQAGWTIPNIPKPGQEIGGLPGSNRI